MSKECTTHHHACDCREEKFKQLEQENAALRELISTLGAPAHLNVPIEQWHELREDKQRLDWIAKNRSVSVTERPLAVTPDSLRASIDAARKEAQP